MKTFFFANLFLLLLVFSYNALSMEDSDIFTKKYTITEENFCHAMDIVSKKSSYMAEKLSSKLRKHIGHNLSAEEWSKEVQIAYREILSVLPKTAQITIKMTFSESTAVLACIWAIPS